MSKINAYFREHLLLSLTLTWVFLGIAVGYALLSLLVFPNLFYWIMLLPAVIALYFRLMYNKGYLKKYPERDKYSGEYIPYKERKKLEDEKKRQQNQQKK
jgi:hypothetical protein